MELFERAKRDLAREIFLKHIYAEDDRPGVRSRKRAIGRPISRFARVPPTRKQLSKTTIALESTGFDWLRAAFTGELQGRYVIREPVGEKVRRWFNITTPDSDYTDSDLVTFFHRQKPLLSLEEYAASLKTDSAVQERAEELVTKARASKLDDAFLGPDGLVLVKLLQENDNRNQARGYLADVADIALDVASRFEARDRILDSLHQDELIGRTKIHRAVITPKHADRLAAFLDLPRTQQEYHRFWTPDPENRTRYRFDENLWKKFRIWDPESKTWVLDRDRYWKDKTIRSFRECDGWNIHSIDFDPKTRRAEVSFSIPLTTLRTQMAEEAKNLAAEQDQFAPEGEKGGKYWRARASFYREADPRNLLLKLGARSRLKTSVMNDFNRAMRERMFGLNLGFGPRESISSRIRIRNKEKHIQMRIRFSGFKPGRH